MSCFSYRIIIPESEKDVEIALLIQLGVENFIEYDDGFEAFVDEKQNLEHDVENYFDQRKLKYEKIKHETRDWNAEWESGYSAFTIGQHLRIRATFHDPDKHYKQEFILAPRMAFGTGHHETTAMVLEWMLENKMMLRGMKVLDFGCGTGVLGIYAALNAAANVDFVDNDPLAVENTLENLALNEMKNHRVILGSYHEIIQDDYNLILANVTRNILCEGLHRLVEHLAAKGKIILSGFLVKDAEIMQNLLLENQLLVKGKMQKKDWLCLIAEKQ